MLPALLATAEDVGRVSGRDFLLAMAIGAELHARLGLACYNSLGKGWHPTMVFGTPAASLAAGRLLGLDAGGLANALGMAYHQTSGSAQSMRDGVLSKRLGAGLCRAQRGRRCFSRSRRPHRDAAHARRHRGPLRALRAR